MLQAHDASFGLDGYGATRDALKSNTNYGTGLGAQAYENYLTSSIGNNSLPKTSDVLELANREGLFGISQGNWGNIGTGAQALSGLANVYGNLKQLGLAEDTFNFNKDMANKQYAMAKDAYDRNVARADSISKQMAAGKVGEA